MAGTPIDELINNLYEMVEDAWSMPLGSDRCVLEREKALDLLDEIRANLPSDLKMAREIVEKRNEIIAAGKKEYDSLRAQAEEYARQRINDHEITQEARKKAQEIVSAADLRSREIMKVASEYCEDAMKRTEEALDQISGEVKQSRGQFRAALREAQNKRGEDQAK
jgi:cell division septum initiation protein DivIVA